MRLLSFASMGLEFGITVVVGLLAGLQMDEWLNSSPFGVLLGIIGGMAVSIVRLLHFLKLLKDRSNSTEDHDR